MPVTVGSLTLRQLQQLPFQHGGDSITGQTARRWPIKALCTPAEWLTLDGIYQTWRTARLADPAFQARRRWEAVDPDLGDDAEDLA